MTTEIQTSNSPPTDARTGLTLPLSKSLALPDLSRHRALVAVELEVLAKKFDRFGWDRDRGSAAHDRMVVDWMDALQDYPIFEVREACRAEVKATPNHMPNEGHILGKIMEARKTFVAARQSPYAQPMGRPVVSKEAAQEIMQAAGFAPRRVGEA